MRPFWRGKFLSYPRDSELMLELQRLAMSLLTASVTIFLTGFLLNWTIINSLTSVFEREERKLLGFIHQSTGISYPAVPHPKKTNLVAIFYEHHEHREGDCGTEIDKRIDRAQKVLYKFDHTIFPKIRHHVFVKSYWVVASIIIQIFLTAAIVYMLHAETANYIQSSTYILGIMFAIVFLLLLNVIDILYFGHKAYDLLGKLPSVE